MISARASGVVLLATLSLASAAGGQITSTSGSLYGTAIDQEGKTVSDVTVRLTGPGAAQIVHTARRVTFTS